MKTMTTQEARAIFEEAEKEAKTPEKLANVQLLKEYFTNPTFRKGLEAHIFELNTKGAL